MGVRAAAVFLQTSGTRPWLLRWIEFQLAGKKPEKFG